MTDKRRRARFVERLEEDLHDVPFEVVVETADGEVARFAGVEPHWLGEPLRVKVKTERAVQLWIDRDAFGFLEAYLDGEVELSGNLYRLAAMRKHLGARLGVGRGLLHLARNSLRQTRARAQRNVRSHYDVPQEVLELYLDNVFRSYSCGVFEEPARRDRESLVRVGVGKEDAFDSLEKSQWRKFREAVDLLDVGPRDSLLDIGTGYGGLLQVALSDGLTRRAVGWTHSENQAAGAREALWEFPADRWEIHEGDYRDECRRFDRVASIGMVSHVGPGGLQPYVRRVRKLVEPGGLYLHHDLMVPYNRLPLNFQVGPAFNKRYVWPGFHWFTLGQHVKALERNGFKIRRIEDLSVHYAKTTAAWYERMTDASDSVRELLGDAGFRAWSVFLAGISGSLDAGAVYDYRVLCEAT